MAVAPAAAVVVVADVDVMAEVAAAGAAVAGAAAAGMVACGVDDGPQGASIEMSNNSINTFRFGDIPISFR